MRYILRFALALIIALPLIQHSTLPAGATEGFTVSTVAREPLADSKVSELVGRAVGADCAFEFPEIVIEEYGTRVVRVIGVDPDDCRLLLEEGTPITEPSLPSRGKGVRFDSVEADPIPAQAQNPPGAEASFAAAAVQRLRGYHVVRYQDPVGITVNSVVTEIWWTFNGSCAYSGSTWGSFSWASWSGWVRNSYAVEQSIDPSCKWYRGSSRATYSNAQFCPPKTWAYYNYVNTVGYNNGNVGVGRFTSTAGSCWDWLGVSFWYGKEPA